MNNLSHHKSGPIEFFERKGHSEIEVVLLHGIGSNALSFESLIKELPDSWRLIAWNAPGYGDSNPLKPDWPIAEDYALALTTQKMFQNCCLHLQHWATVKQ